MRKLWWPALILGLSAALSGCSNDGNAPAAPGAGGQAPETGQHQAIDEKAEKEAIVRLAQDFGKQLQMVSVLAPADVLSRSMQEHYGDLISPSLLEKWLGDPEQAPGRTVSSPWPDRIEVSAAQKVSEDRYEVQGEIIDITSSEQADGGVAAKRPIRLEIRKIDNRWLIDAVTLGDYRETDQEGPAEPAASAYVNTEYGFQFALPESWRGYTIVTDEWKGTAAEGAPSDLPALTGPMISIRHPAWTEENPRQDIPILVFTLDQWNALQKDDFHIGAAPIGPRELGRNSEYVFALPARYNYAFPTGYEEVEDILENQPLKPM